MSDQIPRPDQTSKVSWAPPVWLIPPLSSVQTWLFRRSGGRIGARSGGMPNLVLETVGRRSGRRHAVTLPYWLDEGDNPVVVASFAGGPNHPDWFHNLADLTANPTVDIQIGADRRPMRAEPLQGDDRVPLWDALTADWAHIVAYQEHTDREIPLVRFVPMENL